MQEERVRPAQKPSVKTELTKRIACGRAIASKGLINGQLNAFISLITMISAIPSHNLPFHELVLLWVLRWRGVREHISIDFRSVQLISVRRIVFLFVLCCCRRSSTRRSLYTHICF